MKCCYQQMLNKICQDLEKQEVCQCEHTAGYFITWTTVADKNGLDIDIQQAQMSGEHHDFTCH